MEWEVDPDAYPTDIAGVADPNFRAYMDKHKANYRHYSKVVDILEYDEPCSMDVHFLPCQEVKITLSCHATNHPDYPIKEPSFMEEPAVCQK